MMKRIKAALGKHIKDICGVSYFFSPTRYSVDMNNAAFKTYIKYSRRRFDVIRQKFEEMGYKTKLQRFKFTDLFDRSNSFPAVNGIFRKNGRAANKQIWVTGHHDYCAGLGAEDNATSLAVMLEVANHFKNSEKCNNLVFASFDLEEIGIEGSGYCAENMYERDLKKIKYLINLECLGSGKDITICNSVANGESDAGLVKKLYKTGKSLGYEFIIDDYDYFSSDHVQFEYEGVKTVEVCSLDHEAYLKFGGVVGPGRKDGSVAHTSQDLPENIKLENLLKVTRTLELFIEKES